MENNIFPFTKTNTEKLISKLNLVFILEGFIVFFIAVLGGIDYIITNPNIFFMLSVGLITFISIFFNFVYNPPTNLISQFNLSINSMEKQKRKAGEYADSPDKLRKIATEWEEIKSFKRKINPELWLYLSIFAFLIGLLFAFTQLNDKIYKFLWFFQVIFFNIGIFATICLITSIASISLITRKL